MICNIQPDWRCVESVDTVTRYGTMCIRLLSFDSFNGGVFAAIDPVDGGIVVVVTAFLIGSQG